MKACIVSMEYKIKNNDGKKEVATLGESNKDAEKVKKLFESTLGWQSNNISTFKDSSVGIMNVYDKINERIQVRKYNGLENTNENEY
jgi:hypothetical protein